MECTSEPGSCHIPINHFRCNAHPYTYIENPSATIYPTFPVQCTSIYLHIYPASYHTLTISRTVHIHISKQKIPQFPYTHHFRYSAHPYTYIENRSVTIYPSFPVQCTSISLHTEPINYHIPTISGPMYIHTLTQRTGQLPYTHNFRDNAHPHPYIENPSVYIYPPFPVQCTCTSILQKLYRFQTLHPPPSFGVFRASQSHRIGPLNSVLPSTCQGSN